MTTRTARMLLALVGVGTTLVAIRYHPGLDLISNIWSPIRGLMAGLNPYDPGDRAYLTQFKDPFRNPVFAAPYLPAALTLFAPLGLLTQDHATSVMAVLNVAFLWLGVLLLIPPRDPKHCLVAGAAGSAVILTAPAQLTIWLGQLAAPAFAGVALLVTSLNRRNTATWVPALGAALVALKPQSAMPIVMALAALGLWQVVWRTIAILAVASAPWVVLLIRSMSSTSGIFHIARENLNAFSNLPADDLANPINLRLDALGLIAHLGGPALTGLGWLFAGFLIVTAVFVLILWRSGHLGRGRQAVADPWVVTLLGLYVLSAHYHLIYDQLLLYVGPLLAFGVELRAGGTATGSPARTLTRVGLVLLAVGIVFRNGVTGWFLDHGVPLLAVYVPWVITPSLITIAAVGWRFGRRTVSGAPGEVAPA